MKVYFIRHGLSQLGEERYQLPETPLSHEGLKQAQSIANRLSKISFDLILSSPHTRSLQTAEEIQKVNKVALTKSDLLIERKMPTQFLGKEVKDREIAPHRKMIQSHFFETGWHFTDEENFTDLSTRAKAALKFIQLQNKESIIVVTHGYFLLVLIYSILFEGAEHSLQFRSFRSHIQFSNTGLTLCEYKENKWKVITVNDLVHLGQQFKR